MTTVCRMPYASMASSAAAVTRALTGRQPVPPAGLRRAAKLRTRVDGAWRLWQTSSNRFSEADNILPTLIGDVEHAAWIHGRECPPQTRRELLGIAADLYGLFRSYCRRAGRLDLSLLVADRAIRAAEEAEDPVRLTTARWNLGHVLLSHGDPSAVDEAKEIALQAIEQLRRAPAAVPRRE